MERALGLLRKIQRMNSIVHDIHTGWDEDRRILSGMHGIYTPMSRHIAYKYRI